MVNCLSCCFQKSDGRGTIRGLKDEDFIDRCNRIHWEKTTPRAVGTRP